MLYIQSQIQQQQQNQQPQQHPHPRQRSSNQNLTQGHSSLNKTGIELGNFVKPVAIKQEEFFVLDNHNRVILVSVNPNAATAHIPPQLPKSTCSGNGSKQKSMNRQGNSFANENLNTQSLNGGLHQAAYQQHSQQPLIGNQQVNCSSQQKIVEQLSGKPTSKRKTSMANHQALKENTEMAFSRQESAHMRDLGDQKSTRNDTMANQKANRNSNQNIKMVGGAMVGGAGVTRFGSTASNFSATISTYNSLMQPSQPITLSAPPKGFIYQLDQSGNYVLAQVAPTQQQMAPNMSAQLRQLQLVQPGQRPQANQIYFSNQHHVHLHKLQSGHQGQNQVGNGQQPNLQVQYQSNTTSSQQSMHSQSNGNMRPRPRSSAPTASVNSNIKRGSSHLQGGGAGGVASRDNGLRVQMSSSGHQVLDMCDEGTKYNQMQHRLASENLIQNAGHIIVTSTQLQQNGTHLNELQMPMIINQSNVSHPNSVIHQGGNSANLQHHLDHPQLIMQQQTGSQPRSNRRDGSTTHAQTQNGFFVKRNRRDSKLGFPQQHQLQPTQQQSHTPQTTSNSSKIAITQLGGAQAFFVQESIQSSSQNRPSTGSGAGSSGYHQHHKTTASVSTKLNGNSRVSQQPTTAPGESDSENTNRALVGESLVAAALSSGMTFCANRNSVQGQQLQNQKNLSSVRSGQLINYTNSICTEGGSGDPTIFSKDQLGVHKQNSCSDKNKILNTSSASPSTKINVRGRKGISSIIGNGITAQSGVAGPGLQMLPSTPKMYKRTKRVLFARRMNLMDRPVLVITFQGVLGDFMKKQAVCGLKETAITGQPTGTQAQSKKEQKQGAAVQQREEDNVYLRAGVAEGLKYLSSLFQLIIFSRETVEDSWFQSKGGQLPQSGVQTKAILSWLQQNPDIKLDGFYASCVSAKQQTMTEDYSQIFIDFGLNSEHKIKEKVLFVTSIDNDFICNQRLPVSGNLSPRSKKPSAAQLGISNARGLTDIDPYGYFMFDTACQPAQPLVKGVPIAIDVKQSKQTNRLTGARSSSLIADQDDNASCGGNDQADSAIKTRNMPSTLLVPNLRTQSVKLQTNFQHVIKSIMMLAFLGQKKSSGKHLIKESSVRDLTSDLVEVEAQFGYIKEKQVRLTKHAFNIVQPHQLHRGMIEAGATATAGFSNNLNKSQKAASLQRRIRQAQGNSAGCSVVGPPREAESPTSDMSGHNGSRGRRLKHQGSGKNHLNLKQMTMTSSRTAATTHIGNENTGSSSHSNQHQNQQQSQTGQNAKISVHKLRSSSVNSDNGLNQHANTSGVADPSSSHLLTNESATHVGQQLEQSPRVVYPGSSTAIEPGTSREVTVDLSDGCFFVNVSWSAGVDYLSLRPLNLQKRFLGMQALCSDVVWRFYKRQAEERIKLRQLYEARMQATEQLVTKTLANETIVKNQQKSIDQIYEILRSRDLVGNPFGFTMGRNYRFFANMKFQQRKQLKKELEQWKARSEAAAAQKKPKGEAMAGEAATTPAAAVAAAAPMEMTVEDRELAEATRMNSIIQSQQVLQQQQHEAIEELLEKNKLMNRFVVVGLDAPALK